MEEDEPGPTPARRLRVLKVMSDSHSFSSRMTPAATQKISIAVTTVLPRVEPHAPCYTPGMEAHPSPGVVSDLGAAPRSLETLAAFAPFLYPPAL